MAAAASFSSFCSLQLSVCLLLPDFQQQSLCNNQGSQAVEGQKNISLLVATFQRKARGSLCSCWHASALGFCTILSMALLSFSQVPPPFPLPEMYQLVFHILGRFSPLCMFLLFPLTGFCWCHFCPCTAGLSLPSLHCPYSPAADFPRSVLHWLPLSTLPRRQTISSSSVIFSLAINFPFAFSCLLLFCITDHILPPFIKPVCCKMSHDLCFCHIFSCLYFLTLVPTAGWQHWILCIPSTTLFHRLTTLCLCTVIAEAVPMLLLCSPASPSPFSLPFW